jgi:hypothetical protein
MRWDFGDKAGEAEYGVEGGVSGVVCVGTQAFWLFIIGSARDDGDDAGEEEGAGRARA